MPKIEYIWVYIAEDAGPDDEGIPAFRFEDTMYPLLAADQDRLDSIGKMAQDICNKTGKTLRLVRFSQRQDLETLRPVGTNGG